MKPNLQLVRALFNEIRKISPEKKLKNNIMVTHILEQLDNHKETTEVLCKARTELRNLGENYLLYLSSLRKCQEIHLNYAGKGERSVKETADLVGFKLPHDPK